MYGRILQCQHFVTDLHEEVDYWEATVLCIQQTNCFVDVQQYHCNYKRIKSMTSSAVNVTRVHNVSWFLIFLQQHTLKCFILDFSWICFRLLKPSEQKKFCLDLSAF